eukprot:12319_1
MQINRILLFITLFILTKRLKTESLGDNISCEDTILDTISDSNANDSSHLYELTINNTYNVNFDACRSNIDLVIVIFDDLDNDISNSYCSNGDWCGQCDEYNNGYPENFTIPSMVSGKYVIQIEPYSAGGQYEILVNCMDPPPLSNVTSSPSNINITCSDTISNSIDFPESQYYTLMVDDYYDNINFDSCQSQADIKIIILDDTNNDISDQYCSNGDYCGSCSNIAFYAENFTIPMFTSGKYYIHIQTFQSFASSNQYQVKINCIVLNNSTSFTTTQMYTTQTNTNPNNHSYYSCGDMITSSFIDETVDLIDIEQIHYYQFQLNASYGVNFDSCDSELDIVIVVFDDLNTDLSDLQQYIYCSAYGDPNCECNDILWSPENFTIPIMSAGQYLISVTSAYSFTLGGDYQIQMKCMQPVKQSFTPADCDLYTNETYVIYPSQNVSNSVVIKRDTIEIEFEIKLNRHCVTNTCNILHIGNEAGFKFPSLNINGYRNYFEIVTTNNVHFYDTYTVPNANLIIPTDDMYHRIYLSYTRNKRVFKVDDVIYYSTNYAVKPFIPSTRELYSLYISSPLYMPNGINGTVQNVCIKSFKMNIENEIKCGDMIYGALTSLSDIHYYLFNSSQDLSEVLFDSCGSSYDTYMYLFGEDNSVLYQGDDDGDCGNREMLLTNFLVAGQYILGVSGCCTDDIHHFGAYKIQVICDAFTNNKDNKYIGVPAWSATAWHHGELICERDFGTSLATITTKQDIHDAMSEFKVYGDDAAGLWIGMYRNAVNSSSWQWVAGTSCNYTATSNCIDDQNWDHTQPDVHSTQYVVGTYLFGNGTTAKIFSQRDATDDFGNGVICNARNSKYNVNKCTKNCWMHLDCCQDLILNLDLVFDLPDSIVNHSSSVNWRFNTYFPAISYWKSNLVVVGVNQVHHTHFELLANTSAWSHMVYNDGEFDLHNLNMMSQRYTQYQSSLHLYLEAKDKDEDVLVHVNLDTMDMTSSVIPSEIYLTYAEKNGGGRFCVTSDAVHIYIVAAPSLVTYNTITYTWTVTTMQKLFPVACAITNNHDYIYIFSGDIVIDQEDHTPEIIKYNIKTTEFSGVEAPNLCYAHTASTATGRDDKIYLHGCYTGSWKTLIFDPKMEEFEIETIDIDFPTNTFYYRYSQLTVFDDNILLLRHTTELKLSALYYSITDLISINFTNTEIILSNDSIWPSDGFMIKYYLNDFTNINLYTS